MVDDQITKIFILLSAFSATIRDFEEDIRIFQKALINGQLLKE
jgi:hypothetical protein